MNIFDKFKNLTESLKKTKESLAQKIGSIFTGGGLPPDYMEKLEEALVLSDISFQTASDIINSVKKDIPGAGSITSGEFKGFLKREIKKMISKEFPPLNIDDKKGIILIVGVNGVGKTTTVAKLGNFYKNKGKKVIVGACDTFRAAAQEQLAIWGERTGIEVVSGKENQDPASVAHDAVQKLKEKDFDLLIIDTAGRLHNKKHLMEELAKIKRVIMKANSTPPDETFIIIDASLGQNSITQAAQFRELVDITGVIITKMDGSARGGIAIDVIHKLGLPVRFIGTGEKPENISDFSPEIFVEGLL